MAVSLSNSYRLRPLVAPALFLHEPRDSDVCGRSMMPCGNPFCGWLVDREADRLLHKFNRLESRQINLSSLLQEEAWGISGAEEIQLKAWSAQSLIVVLLVLGVDIHRNSQGSPRA